MLQLLKISPQNPLMRLFGLSKKDVPAKDYETLKNDPHQPFARFTTDDNGNERMEFAIRQVERDGQEPAFGYKGWTSADPRALDNGTKNAMINVTNQIMGKIQSMYHGADAAKSEMSETNAAFYRSVADEIAQEQAANKPFNAIAAGFDEDKNSYDVRIYGDFSNNMFASVRNNLIESGHLVLASDNVREHIRTEAARDPETRHILFNANMHVSEDAYNFLDNLHQQAEKSAQLEAAIKRADDAYGDAMTIENTPDEFLYPDREHYHDSDYDGDHASSVYVANAADDYDSQRETYEMTIENTPDDFLYPDRDDGYSPERKKSFYHDVNMENFSVKAEFIDEAGILELQAHNDYSYLNQDDRQNLIDTGYLKSDNDGNEYLAFPAIVYAGDAVFDLVVDYENTSDRTADLLSTVVNRVNSEDLQTLDILIEGRGNNLSDATRPEQVDVVAHSGDAEIEEPSYDLNGFKAKQISDSEMDVTLPKLELLDTEYQGTIDELYESGHLIMREDGTSVLRIEHDENGKILDAEDTTGFDNLPYRSQILLEAIHSELGHELQATVDRELKEEAKDNVVSHHGFLKENRMHQSGYLLLSVEGSDWKDIPEDDLREQGLSIANGKWAAKFTLDESGKPVFESRATSEVGKEFERQHLNTHSSVVDWNCSQRHEQNEAKRLAQAEAYADKNGFILKSEGDKYALLPKSQFAAREDGLKSVMATVGTTAHFAKLQSLSELKTVMREAKTLDKAHHKHFSDQKMPFNVVTQRGWDFAVRKFEANDKLKSVSVKTTAGDKIQLMRPSGQLDYTQRDLGITSKNVATGQTGQRVVVNGTREHSQAVQNSMIKDGIYINKSKDGYVIGHLQEPKPRFFEKSPAMALRAAVVTKNQVAHEKQAAAQRQVEETRAKEQERSSAVMSA